MSCKIFEQDDPENIKTKLKRNENLILEKKKGYYYSYNEKYIK
jgi:hypothetical protein